MQTSTHAVTTIIRGCVRGLALSFVLLFVGVVRAAESPVDISGAVARFDGSQNLLAGCVALQNADGSAQVDAAGKPRIYDVVLKLDRPTLTFTLQSALPVDIASGRACGGVFRNGVYTDVVLITGLSPLHDDRLWHVTLDYIVNPAVSVAFRLRRVESASPNPQPADAAIAFDFAATTTAEDQQLIRDTVLFARDFLQSAFGRSLQENTTITTLGPSGGCTNPGASAFAGPRSLTFCTGNQGWTIHGPVTKRKILIHEVFHLLQFELRWLGGPPGSITGPHWLVEGAAEYVGWLGIAARGDIALGTAHGCMLKEVADFAVRQPPGLPNLSGFETRQSFGGGPVYPLAMIGAKQLVDTSSLARLLSYGSALAGGTAWTTAFSASFGTTPLDFYAQFPAYRTGLEVPSAYACRI